MSNFLWPHWFQHTRIPCPSPTPGAYSNSCPLTQRCYPTISVSVIFSSHLQSFPASGSFQLGVIFFLIFKLYKIVLVLPNIKMNPPQVYMCSLSWTLLPPPSPYHPSGSSQCTMTHLKRPSQHQGLFKWVSSSQQVAKVLEFQVQHQSFQWIFRTDFL